MKTRLTFVIFICAVVYTVLKFIINGDYLHLFVGAPIPIISEVFFCLGAVIMLTAAGQLSRRESLRWRDVVKRAARADLLEVAKASLNLRLSQLGLLLNWSGALMLPAYVLYLQIDAYPYTDWSIVGVWVGDIVATFGVRFQILALIEGWRLTPRRLRNQQIDSRKEASRA